MQKLYEKYYIESDNEQCDLYEFLSTMFHVTNALYPGSFVQISPSFYIPYVCYIDGNRKAKSVFKHIQNVADYIQPRASYLEDVKLSFYYQDYTKPINEPKDSFDLLITQYTKLEDPVYKQYLKKGGHVLATDCMGNASRVSLDGDFILAGIFNRLGGKYYFSQDNLKEYFIPKSKDKDIALHLRETGRGASYKKAAAYYLFKKVR